MAVELRPVTADNFDDLVRLSVRDDQQGLVTPNLYSLAQARVYPDWQPMGIYADGTPVGFIMWGIAPDLSGPEWWIIRLMIAAGQQGRGYGRAAMLEALERLRCAGAEAVYISFEPENAVAETLYRSLGFQDTGRIADGEIVYRLSLKEGGA